MATRNFGIPNYDLPLIVGGTGDDFDTRAKDYKENYGEEYTEDMYYTDIDFEIEDMRNELDEFNKELKHFEMIIEPGYYVGYYFNAKQNDDYVDYEDIATLNDEDAMYFYGGSAKEIRQEFRDDMKMIKNYLKDLKDRGYKELYCAGVFSNGEAIYKEAK